MRIESVSNGQGGQSLYLCWLASQGKIPATVSITADTGGELDCTWNTGERSTAQQFFEQVTKPLCNEWGLDARFVRAESGDKTPMPSIEDYHGESAPNTSAMPLFGSNGGRLMQTCTDRWKITAIKQEARRMGATHLCSAQGIHAGEASRRIKGQFLHTKNGMDIYQTGYKNKETKEWVLVKWMSHYYPLYHLRLDRSGVRRELEKLDIPYLVSTECDCCPHKDATRWLRTSPATIERVANLESRYNGEFFFTDRLKPLRQVIAEMKEEERVNPNLFADDAATFECDSGFCGV